MSRKYTKRADRKIDKLNAFKTATQLPQKISIFSVFSLNKSNNNNNDNNNNNNNNNNNLYQNSPVPGFSETIQNNY